jgi:hypothetical protein
MRKTVEKTLLTQGFHHDSTFEGMEGADVSFKGIEGVSARKDETHQCHI